MTSGAYLAHRGGHRCGHRHGDGGTVPDGCGIARRHPASPATAGAACGRASRKGEVSAVLASFGSHGNAATVPEVFARAFTGHLRHGDHAGTVRVLPVWERASWCGANVPCLACRAAPPEVPDTYGMQGWPKLSEDALAGLPGQHPVIQGACAEGLRPSRPDSRPDSCPVSQLASHRAFVLEGIKVSSVAAARRPFGVPPLPLHALRQGCTRRQCCTP